MYEPSESDKRWLQNLIAIVRDGAIWATSFAIYRIDKHKKELWEVPVGAPFTAADPHGLEDRARVKAVAEAIGWSVNQEPED